MHRPWVPAHPLPASPKQCVFEGEGAFASSVQHHQGDGPASSLGRVSMGTEQCALGGLVVEIEA